MTGDSAQEPTPSAGMDTYVLVMLRRCGAADDNGQVQPAHEQFITDLIRRNVILLGGGFADAIGDAEAAYVLRCSLEEAEMIANNDPLVVSGVMRADCVEWQLVGVNPDAIDTKAIIRPRDV
jgi:uncharacterized protein YciI